jgi:hypothetical protein
MTKLAVLPFLGIGLAAAAAAILPPPLVGATGAADTSAADTSAADTITHWQHQGYTVNIDRVGTAPLDECKVTSVRNPITITRLNREDRSAGHVGDLVPIVVSKTIKISLDCTGHS